MQIRLGALVVISHRRPSDMYFLEGLKGGEDVNVSH